MVWQKVTRLEAHPLPALLERQAASPRGAAIYPINELALND